MSYNSVQSYMTYMAIIKITLYAFLLTSISSCMVSFPENKINIAHAGVSEETACRLSRLENYSLPSLPDISGMDIVSDDEIQLVNALVEHIGLLRKDLSLLKQKKCVN